MLVDKPDLVVWRKSAAAAKQTKMSLVGLDGLAGFAISQKNSRFDIFDRNGSFVASETRESPSLTGAQPKEGAAVEEAVARHLLKRPYRMAESRFHNGAAVNIQANYAAVTALLMDGKGHEEHMVGVSWAAIGGGDVLFVDPTSAPQGMQDSFLDSMRQIKNGAIIDWAVYDQEMLRAACSYREQCFCGWLIKAAARNMSPAEVMLRMSMLDQKERHRLVMESLPALLPHITYYTGEDKYAAETLEPHSPITLPSCALSVLS